MRFGARGSAGEKFVAEENETQQRRTIVAVSERDGEPGWTTGDKNEERRHILIPKEREWMDRWWDTIEGLNLVVEWAGVRYWGITPCCWCLVVMKHDHDGGDEKEIWRRVVEFEAADDEKEKVWPKECGRETRPELRNERSQKWEKESRAEEVMIE